MGKADWLMPVKLHQIWEAKGDWYPSGEAKQLFGILLAIYQWSQQQEQPLEKLTAMQLPLLLPVLEQPPSRKYELKRVQAALMWAVLVKPFFGLSR